MAYKNLLGILCANKAEYFCRFRDFLAKRNGTYDYSTAGIGWSIIDSSYSVDEDNPQSDDWVVFHSTGEDGKQNIYFRFKWDGTTYFGLANYLWWNTTTHAGVSGETYTNNFRVDETVSSWPIWLYGDLNFFIAIFKYSTTVYYSGWVGKTLPLYEDISSDVMTCSTALSVGSDVSIVLDAVDSTWVVGQEIYIWKADSTYQSIEKITIKTLVGTTITADLTKNYSSGATLSSHHGVGVVSNSNAQYGGSFTIGPHGGLNLVAALTIDSAFSSLTDPDNFNDLRGLSKVKLGDVTQGAVGSLPNVYAMGATGMTQGDVLVDYPSGENSYRYFSLYSNLSVAIKEV